MLATNLKDDEICFLRGHVAQLAQSISQFALKPGEEEIKKKVGLGGSGSDAHRHLRQKIYLVFLFGELTNIKPAAIPRRIT